MNFYIPTKQQIQSYQVGDLAPNCFGEGRITEIYAKQQNVQGKWFICYYTQLREGSTISHSLTEDKLDRTLALSKNYTSHQLDDIERQLLKERNQ